MSFWRVRDRSIHPKGGYSFVEPADGHVLHGNSLGAIHSAVKDYRLANHIPIGRDLLLEIEQQHCKEHPAACHETNEHGATLNIIQAAGNFTKSAFRWAKQGAPLVDETIFEQRKSLCDACPNKKGWKDYGIAWCGLCKCSNGKVAPKLWMATEHCPDKPPRWLAVPASPENPT